MVQNLFYLVSTLGVLVGVLGYLRSLKRSAFADTLEAINYLKRAQNDFVMSVGGDDVYREHYYAIEFLSALEIVCSFLNHKVVSQHTSKLLRTYIVGSIQIVGGNDMYTETIKACFDSEDSFCEIRDFIHRDKSIFGDMKSIRDTFRIT